MIRLSKLSDYAVVVLGVLHQNAGSGLSAPQIAEASQVPEPTVSKVLKLMAAPGLVVSSRGVNGGYTLNRTAPDISVYEIVTAIQGPLMLTACADDSAEEPCALEKMCGMSGRWHAVNDAVRLALSGISLADMVADDPAVRRPRMELA